MEKYKNYTKEQLLEVIEEKNKMIYKINGRVYYYKKLAEHLKKQRRK